MVKKKALLETVGLFLPLMGFTHEQTPARVAP